MKKEYAIIYWNKEGAVIPVMNDVGGLKVLDVLKDADTLAFEIEDKMSVEARVITIESVHE